jgi:hypothetical protein
LCPSRLAPFGQIGASLGRRLGSSCLSIRDPH